MKMKLSGIESLRKDNSKRLKAAQELEVQLIKAEGALLRFPVCVW